MTIGQGCDILHIEIMFCVKGPGNESIGFVKRTEKPDTSKPDKGREKVFYEKYANTKPDHFKEAPAMLENYGVFLAAPVIQAMTDCERDRRGIQLWQLFRLVPSMQEHICY